LAAGLLLEHSFDLVGRLSGSRETSAETAAPEQPAAGYVCPMHPEVVDEEPGSCPVCGMDLVPASPEEPAAMTHGDGSLVYIDPTVAHNLAVRSARVGRETLGRHIETVGYVEYDRTKLSDIYGPADGYINGLTLRSEGERVKKGQFLFQLDSPTLSTYYDKTFARQDGIVAALYVIEGEFVNPTTKLLTLADLSSVWVLADVFEGQAHWVARGQRVTVRLPYVADRSWEGKVEYLYPNLDPETRTLKVRIRIDNPDEILKPNMHAEVTIHGGHKREVLAIPREALIDLLDSESSLKASLSRLYPSTAK
jgi:Cu(I)/Ag(I) efflux system membrane fusion protein